MTGGKRTRFIDGLAWVILGVSLILLIATIAFLRSPGDTLDASHKMEKAVSKRLLKLESFVSAALDQDVNDWMYLPSLPEDMFVYRYVNDSLQSWSNNLFVSNDDISKKTVFPRLTNPRSGMSSQLASSSSELTYLNLGPKWFLVESVENEQCRIIAGLEIVNTQDYAAGNGVNPRLKLKDTFSVSPLDDSGGSPVNVDGKPKFKVVDESLQPSWTTNTYLIWLAYSLFILAFLVFLINRRTIKRFLRFCTAVIVVTALMFLWGKTLQSDVKLFSPLVFAHGSFFYSLGAVLIVNLAISLLSLGLYLFRRGMYHRLLASRSADLMIKIWSTGVMTMVVAILVYTFYVFRSIVRNSGITLELYMIDELSAYSALVYLSFIVLLMMIPLLLQLLRPISERLFSYRYNAISTKGRIVYSVLVSLYLVVLSSWFGFRKEQGKIGVWANMLSVDRDVSLELELRSADNQIASDILISTLSMMNNSGTSILNRITDTYLYNVSQNYEISALVLKDNEPSQAGVRYYNERVMDAVPVSPGSRFVVSTTANGHIRYTGVFVYFHQQMGVTRLILGIDPKNIQERKGYSTLLGITSPGQFTIPSGYDYAKYNNGSLSSFRGNYGYPTRLEDKILSQISLGKGQHLIEGGYTHFARVISDDEIIIISRPSIPLSNYFLSFAFISLLCYLTLSVVIWTRRRKSKPEMTYYKSRVLYVLLLSLSATLIIMSFVSVIFVYRRNESNLKAMMSDKVTSIQAMLQDVFSDISDGKEILSAERYPSFRKVCEVSSADIVLYSVSGKLLASSNLDVYDRMLLPVRINPDAYYAIMYQNKRYCFLFETIGERHYYALYAPVFNSEGNVTALMCSPYVDDNYDFTLDAVRHSITIVTLFFILLILARFMAVSIVSKIFKPLTEMSKKMIATNVEDLEYIDYNNDDEISYLVRAYNRMVKDLSESTRQLAQAERDKAWSAMARQVAHEIKNPLTPMKLQLQRIIRLKEKNAPQWETKFDEVAAIVLEHIDILTDTANEFSTFAKLYGEEHTLIDIDTLLREEVYMYDSRENVNISYIGLLGAEVMGPKPQLTRVFVNLLNNAVQAVEAVEDARIRVSLRKSTKDGYYDIVFEDSGPGVADENISKLFTPNFTTKSSGTGLGLAMCRSILEQCGAEIHYSKSFVLPGACFTVTYPALRAISA